MQSVDRKKILTRLSEQRGEQKGPLNLCIQLNYFAEPQKKGASRQDLPHLLDLASKLPHIKLRGLMVIPPKTDCFETQLIQFKQIKHCFDQYRHQYPQMDTLSMGMSGDIEAAIAAGSNMLRIGTDIFGKRTPKSNQQQPN
ncbi:MAG: YggS family pyridoxal phosphate-dependent enzyme [Enterobacterales bacterium]|nr:YggS family pyridoxal phosphate-dependent enzyme [Enterobacterales bacterium]